MKRFCFDAKDANGELASYHEVEDGMNENASSLPKELKHLILEYTFPATIRQFVSQDVLIMMLMETWKLKRHSIALIFGFTFEDIPPFWIMHRRNAYGLGGSIEQELRMKYKADIVGKTRFRVCYGSNTKRPPCSALEYDMVNHQFLCVSTT